MLWLALALLVSVVIALLTIAALYVDDWRRDFTTNYAATSDDPQSPLAALHSDLSPTELANRTAAAVATLPRWRLTQRDAEGQEVTLHFVHTTRLARFVDDITVRISPHENGSILQAESRSRIGKGDLGQNPRNLRALLEAVEGRLSGK
jgi:uncharacterized protein (DUF1499 family)